MTDFHVGFSGCQYTATASIAAKFFGSVAQEK